MDWKKLLEASVIPPMPKKKDWKIASVGAGDIVNKCHQAAYQKAGFYTAAILSRTRERAERVADSIQTLECVEACYQSIREERVIPIPGRR